MEKLIILDDFPFWTTYLLAAMVAVGFLSALTLLIRSLRPSQRNVRTEPATGSAPTPGVVFRDCRSIGFVVFGLLDVFPLSRSGARA